MHVLTPSLLWVPNSTRRIVAQASLYCCDRVDKLMALYSRDCPQQQDQSSSAKRAYRPTSHIVSIKCHALGRQVAGTAVSELRQWPVVARNL